MRVGPHGLDREVGRDVGVHEGKEGDGEQPELGKRGRLGDGHQALVARARAPERQGHLHEGHRQPQHEREMSKLYDHERRPVLETPTNRAAHRLSI